MKKSQNHKPDIKPYNDNLNLETETDSLVDTNRRDGGLDKTGSPSGEDTIQQALIEKMKRKELEKYFNMKIRNGEGSKGLRIGFKKGHELGKAEQKKKFEGIIEEIIIWARQWAEYVDEERVLKKWREKIGVSEELKQKLGEMK